MHSLEKNIKYLMYLKDKFIVPGLGCFYSKYQESIYSPEEGIITPKEKKILFSSKEKKDTENYLINYISKKELISKELVRTKINEYILHVYDSLYSENKYTIENIGFFYFDDLQKLNFKFVTDINFNLNSFGLKPKTINIVSNKENVNKETLVDKKKSYYRYKIPKNETDKISTNNYSLNIPKYIDFENDIININDNEIKLMNNFWINIFAVLYLIIGISYLIFKKNNTNFSINKSEILDFSIIKSDTIISEAKEIYYIIIASFNSNDIKKVKSFINKFEQKNIKEKLELILDEKSNRYRISYKKSSDRKEIDESLKKIRQYIPDAWVYTIKKD